MNHNDAVPPPRGATSSERARRLPRSSPAIFSPPTPLRSTYTVSEAAKILGISRSTAYQCARTGQLPVLRFGRRLVVPATALRLLID